MPRTTGAAPVGAPLTMVEAAAALRVSRRWLQTFIQTIPPCWLAAGNRKLFDEIALTQIREAMRCRASSSSPKPVGRPVTRYEGPISGSASSALRERLAKGLPPSNRRSKAATPRPKTR
jgi:hypothetical protein